MDVFLWCRDRRIYTYGKCGDDGVENDDMGDDNYIWDYNEDDDGYWDLMMVMTGWDFKGF